MQVASALVVLANLMVQLAVQEDMKQQGEDTYLFNLDHFMLMHQELECREAGQERETLPKLPYDPAIPKNWYDHPERQAARKANGGQDPDSLEANDPYLVIDARVKGVPRFLVRRHMQTLLPPQPLPF